MPDDTAPAGNDPEATATPELSDEQKAALAAVGVEDPGDLAAWKADKGNWDKQHNRMQMEIAEAKSKGDDALAGVLEKQNTLIEKTIESLSPKAPSNDRVIPTELFNKQFGVRSEEDYDREATIGDLYRVGEFVGRQAISRFQQHFGDVPRKEDGSPMTAAEMFSKVQEIERTATASHNAVTSRFQDEIKSAIGTEFPNSDKRVVDRAIEEAAAKGLAGAEFRDYVLGEAKASHEFVAEQVQAARDETRRQLVPTPAYTGAGSGATPSGEKQLNPWKKEDRDKTDTRV